MLAIRSHFRFILRWFDLTIDREGPPTCLVRFTAIICLCSWVLIWFLFRAFFLRRINTFLQGSTTFLIVQERVYLVCFVYFWDLDKWKINFMLLLLPCNSWTSISYFVICRTIFAAFFLTLIFYILFIWRWMRILILKLHLHHLLVHWVNHFYILG